MPRRRSLALDEAAAADARRAAGIDPAEEDGDAEEGVDGSTTEAAAKLRSKYTATAAPVKKGRKKKEEELGPSGMTYTPLEKQYMEIKAKWPDVLLFMEGGRCVR
jgi:DNA mismatch repair protein MSH3